MHKLYAGFEIGGDEYFLWSLYFWKKSFSVSIRYSPLHIASSKYETMTVKMCWRSTLEFRIIGQLYFDKEISEKMPIIRIYKRFHSLRIPKSFQRKMTSNWSDKIFFCSIASSFTHLYYEHKIDFINKENTDIHIWFPSKK